MAATFSAASFARSLSSLAFSEASVLPSSPLLRASSSLCRFSRWACFLRSFLRSRRVFRLSSFCSFSSSSSNSSSTTKSAARSAPSKSAVAEGEDSFSSLFLLLVVLLFLSVGWSTPFFFCAFLFRWLALVLELILVFAALVFTSLFLP